MTTQDEITIIRSVYEAFGRGDIPHILEQLDPEVDWHAAESLPYSRGLYHGPEEVVQFFGALADNFDEPSVEIEDLFSADDRVVALIRFRGAGKNGGARFDAAEAHVWTLSGGKVVELRSYPDTAELLRGLGGAAKVAP